MAVVYVGRTLVDVSAAVTTFGAVALVAGEAVALVLARQVGTAGQGLHTRGTTGPTVGDYNKRAVSGVHEVAQFLPYMSHLCLELCEGARPVSKKQTLHTRIASAFPWGQALALRISSQQTNIVLRLGGYVAVVCRIGGTLVNVPAGYPVTGVAELGAGAGKASDDVCADGVFLHTTGTEPPLVTPPLLPKLRSKPLRRCAFTAYRWSGPLLFKSHTPADEQVLTSV